MGRLCRANTKTSLAANRTRESRPSGMRGGLAETWAMGELGTHLAIERASVGNSPPKVIRAALLPDGVSKHGHHSSMHIGSGRVSTEDHNPDWQLTALPRAGCTRIFIDKATGGHVKRPQ